MKYLRIFVLTYLLVCLTGCAAATPDPQILAATSSAQTAAAASPTTPPTNTPVPTETNTPTPVPTDTPIPTSTNTPIPSLTPTPTVTPGPLVFKDDFSVEDSSVWSNCKICKWQFNTLVMGPYAPGDEGDFSHITICQTCGKHTYYRVAVDANLTGGYGDRFFGVTIADNDKELVMMEISTFQSLIVAKYDYKLNNWMLLNANPQFVFNGMVKPGKAVNHLEVVVKSSGTNTGTVDYYINLNGRTSFIIYGRPAIPSKVGLVVDWHSMEVSFANFEFEELIP
jgi:hypothetical protein